MLIARGDYLNRNGKPVSRQSQCLNFARSLPASLTISSQRLWTMPPNAILRRTLRTGETLNNISARDSKQSQTIVNKRMCPPTLCTCPTKPHRITKEDNSLLAPLPNDGSFTHSKRNPKTPNLFLTAHANLGHHGP